MKAWTRLKSGGRAESLKSAKAHDNPILLLAGGRRLNAEIGDQPIKWRQGSGTSCISEVRLTGPSKIRRGKNIEGCSHNQGLYFGTDAALHQLPSAVTCLTGTGFRSRESNPRTVGRGVFASCTMTMSHFMHEAPGLRHSDPLTSRHAELSRHLTC